MLENALAECPFGLEHGAGEGIGLWWRGSDTGTGTPSIGSYFVHSISVFSSLPLSCTPNGSLLRKLASFFFNAWCYHIVWQVANYTPLAPSAPCRIRHL